MKNDITAKYYGGQSGGRQAAPPQTTPAATGQEAPKGSPPAEVPIKVSTPEVEAPVSEVSTPITDAEKPEPSTDEDVIEIDPNKLIKLPGGETITYAELNRDRLRHSDHIKLRQQVDADRKALDRERTERQAEQTLLTTIARNPKLKSATEYLLDHKSEDEAFRLAGIIPQTQTAPVTPGLPQGVSEPPNPSLDDYEERYEQWYNREYLPAAKREAAKEAVSPEIAELRQRLAAIEDKERQEQQMGAEAERILGKSQQAIETWTGHLKQLTGIDYQTLTVEQRQEAEKLVASALQQRGINPYDQLSLASREVREQEVMDAVWQAYSRPHNPYSAKSQTTTQPTMTKPRVTSKEPISGAPAANANHPSPRSARERDPILRKYY
jgi:hypothetical protein